MVLEALREHFAAFVGETEKLQTNPETHALAGINRVHDARLDFDELLALSRAQRRRREHDQQRPTAGNVVMSVHRGAVERQVARFAVKGDPLAGFVEKQGDPPEKEIARMLP
ncbi:MAG: hypothetical protein WAZ34_10720 [Rhodocyclaceae bacterium]